MLKRILSLVFVFSILNAIYAQNRNISVKFFLLEDCIICQSYTPVMNELYTQYKEEFNFTGYFPNFRSKKESIEKFAEKYKIEFKLKTDYFQNVTESYGVEVTPEVVVVNEDTNEILYQGRIDDEFIEIGKRKRVVLHHDLINALEEIKGGKAVTTPQTIAIGCIIQKKL